MTVDNAVVVQNPAFNIKLALSNDLRSAAIQHPNGRIYQNGNDVNVVAYDALKRNNYMYAARIFFFTSK